MDETFEIKKISPTISFMVNKTKLNERQDVLSQIYECYLASKNHRKIANWKRYVAWLKLSRIPNSEKAQSKFKKSKEFIREYKPATLAYKLSHIKTKDLYYILSIGKDMVNRKENFGGWLLGSIKTKSTVYPQI